VAAGLCAVLALSIVKNTPLSHFLLGMLVASYARLTPLAILVVWLAAAALVPLLAGLGGLIAGLIVRKRRK